MTTPAEKLLAEIRSRQAVKKVPEASFSDGILQGGAEGLLDNVMGIPEFVARGGRGMNNLALNAMGYPMKPIPPEGLLGMPTGREAAAGIDTALGNVGLGGLLDVSPNFDENMARRNQVQSDAPVGQMAGGLLGDAASIATGRMPIMNGRSGGMFDQAINDNINRVVVGLNKDGRSVGVQKFLKDISDSELFRNSARGFGRAGETGIEGLVLSAIQGGDPIEAAALAAGAQLGGSFINSVIDHSFDIGPEVTDGTVGRPKTLFGKTVVLTGYASAMAAINYGMQQLTPEQNSMAMATESGYNKLLAMLLGGATLGIAGMRTKDDGVLNAFPKFADFVTSIPRTAVTSFIADLSKDDSSLAQSTLDRIQQAPNAFTEAQIDQLTKGFEGGDFSERVNRLYESDPAFKAILDAADARLAGVPRNDD
jgi:hypothetical protein